MKRLVKEIFRDRLKVAMAKKQMSPSDFAHEIEVYPSTVGRWLEGKLLPNPAKMVKVCEVLGVSEEFLFTKEKPLSDEINEAQKIIDRATLVALIMNMSDGQVKELLDTLPTPSNELKPRRAKGK